VATEKGWAITGPCGLYTGWWLTRKEAIEAHVRSMVIIDSNNPVRDIWERCKKEGDRAVRVSIKYD